MTDTTHPENATQPTLTVAGGPFDGQVVSVQDHSTTLLGSGPDCALRLDLSNIDAAHARLSWDERGLLLTDLDSSTGTYVNGERIGAEHALQDGDRVCLGPPGSRQTAKLSVRVPAVLHLVDEILDDEAILSDMSSHEPMDPEILDESVAPEPMPNTVAPQPPTGPPPAPSAVPADPVSVKPAPAAAPPAQAKAPARKPEYTTEPPSIADDQPREASSLPPLPPTTLPRAKKAVARPSLPQPALLGGGAVVLLLAAFFGYRWLQVPPPVLVSIVPPRAEPGQTVTIAGSGLGSDPAKLSVKFGGKPGTIVSASDQQVAVTVPEITMTGASADIPVAVEGRGGPSNALFFKVSAAPRILSLSPDVAMPGDEVLANGKNLAGAPLSVIVDGEVAEVKEARANSLRFRVPAIAVGSGRRAGVIVQIGAESSRPATLLVGRLPLILEVTPDRGASGDRVTIRGRGFEAALEANQVAIGGQPALIFSATETELVVATPSVPSPSNQVDAPVVVRARGRSSNAVPYVALRLSSGYFTPRYFPVPSGDRPSRTDLAVVATELGPVLLLGGSGDAPSAAERASRAAAALNAMTQEAATRAVILESREKPATGVAIVGNPGLLLTATPEDAAAYAEISGGRRLAPRAVADFWAALLQDYISLFVRGERPIRLLQLTSRGRALLDIYAETLRRAGRGSGVPLSVLSPLPASLAKSLRDMALIPPADGTAVAAAAMEGRWEGTMDDGGGEKDILVRLSLQGGRLVGGLTTRSGGLGIEVPLRDVSFDRGTLRFVLAAGNTPRRFEGAVQDDAITGTVRLDAGPKESAGRFALRYVE